MFNKMKKLLSILLLSACLGGCSMPGAAQETPSPTMQVVEASPTPTHTLTPEPTSTPTIAFTPTITPTVQPMIGIVKSPTNVRSRPAKAGDRIGGINYLNQVKVLGRNERANWFWIEFPESPTGKGWVVANAIELKGEIGMLAIIAIPGKDYDHPVILPPIIHTVVGQPLPLNEPPAGAVRAIVKQDLFVRVGPGTGYLTLGILSSGSVLTLTGRSEDGKWAQIDYPSGLEGRAWVASDLIEVKDDAAGLSVYNNLATPVSAASNTQQTNSTVDVTATETGQMSPTATPPLPTPSPSGPLGIVTTQINVRTGPASSYQSLGLLKPNDSVVITGRTLSGLWYQIEYATGADGHAWVAAEYIRVNGDLSQLPYFSNDGKPLK
jgi:uncharacterized protein YraI